VNVSAPGHIIAARSWASWATPGIRRQGGADTEDRVLTTGTVFAVADGASRPGHGDVAAALAITEFARSVVAAPQTGTVRDQARAAVEAANSCVLHHAGKHPYEGMMTTLCAAVVWGGGIVVVSVGDSRIVLLRDGGVIPLMQHESHGLPKTFIGGPGQLAVASDSFLAHEGDRLVALTDGLDFLSLEQIGELATDGTTQQAASRLLQATLGQADDDSACVVASLGSFPVAGRPLNPAGPPAQWRARSINDPLERQ
jgi:serine/threonine protein phosphatase PrpC